MQGNSSYSKSIAWGGVDLPPRMFEILPAPVAAASSPHPRCFIPAQQPIRPFSSRYSTLQEEGANKQTFYDVRDPRADIYRDYAPEPQYNPELGHYQYNYIDNFQNPARNKVDIFMPGAVDIPSGYSLAQVKPMVEQKFLADELSFRQEMMTSKMAGNAARDLQKRLYPIRR